MDFVSFKAFRHGRRPNAAKKVETKKTPYLSVERNEGVSAGGLPDQVAPRLCLASPLRPSFCPQKVRSSVLRVIVQYFEQKAATREGRPARPRSLVLLTSTRRSQALLGICGPSFLASSYPWSKNKGTTLVRSSDSIQGRHVVQLDMAAPKVSRLLPRVGVLSCLIHLQTCISYRISELQEYVKDY